MPNYKTCDVLYFDNVRILTELYYYITKSIDSLFIINGANMDILFNTIYLRSIYLLKEITKSKPKTYEHQHMINCFKQQLQTCQIKIYPYLISKPKLWDDDHEDEEEHPDYDPIKEREFYKSNR